MRHVQNLRQSLLALFITGACAEEALASAEGALTIGGVVLPANNLAITSQPGAAALDLSEGASDATVAIVNEKNNDPAGYTVTLISANARAAASGQPSLKGVDVENAAFVNYSLKYGPLGAESELLLNSSGSAVVTSTSAPTPEGGSEKHLKVTVPASGSLNADTYSDTITLTISAK